MNYEAAIKDESAAFKFKDIRSAFTLKYNGKYRSGMKNAFWVNDPTKRQIQMAEYNKTKSHQIRKSDIQEITCLRAAVLPQIRAAAGQMGA